METYATLANRYDRWNLSIAGQFQQAAVLAEVGDLSGRTVLDVGCGTGFYSRLFAAQGAERVVGVDLSAEMIAVARSFPDEIEYLLGDATLGALDGRFDLVAALWLVNHAETRADLDAMIKGFATAGHELLLVTTNADADWDFLGTHAKQYGVQQHPNGPAVDGRLPYVATIFHNDDSFSFQSGSWSLEALTNSLHAAGYRTIKRISPAADAPSPLAAKPPFMILRASID
ncbi:class I SAM-dependent methyltransferase [Kribbella sandramycini]|uniref:SAM-dependent methyltransferase n=1 Tax=Kribbella sandramycini TaxID=60450 RepID=A0A7Y4L7J0_9ACTN|nr:class I SAM-dependent methyltransferase [Kribbella sandramycini]MBB6570265.1 SAM-dependent methyltransferase [Kribbella sandramycini]NOL45817.1 class I SAM-dependent methyltransferase [Kribbella sandramycini]